MDPTLLVLVAGFGVPVALMAVGLFAGAANESTHLASLDAGERTLAHIPVTNGRRPPPGLTATGATLVSGSVVYSVDYFRRFVAALMMLFGGEVDVYARAMSRARREALLRMRTQAATLGARCVINVRVETTVLVRQQDGRQKTMGIEVLAFGTAVR